jgi:hypothetical protein
MDIKIGVKMQNLGCAMSQAIGLEPENPLGNLVPSMEARQVRAMGIHEHAALVEAIMLNFPEIYEDPLDSNQGGYIGAQGNAGPAIQSSSPA